MVRCEFIERNGTFELSCARPIPTFIRDDFPVRVIDVNRALKNGDYLGETQARLELVKNRTAATVSAMGFSATCG